MKPFPGLLTPVYDESFSSWLYRCSMHPRLRSQLRELDFKQTNWKTVGSRLEVDDLDFDFQSEFSTSAMKRLGLNYTTVEKIFSPGRCPVVNWDCCRLYCPDCLRSDIAQGRLPSWRKSSSHEDAVQCQLHHRDLDLLFKAPSVSRAWDAFVENVNNQKPTSPWGEARFSRLRSICCNRVSRWLSDTRRESYHLHITLFHRLYTVFVQAPFRGAAGGSARLYFHGPTSRRVSEPLCLEESLRIGSITADPPIRFGGLLFAGALMEIFPEPMLSAFEKFCSTNNSHWTLKLSQIESLYLPSVDREEFIFLHRYLGQFERKKWSTLDKFLTRQEFRYRREGVYTGVPFSQPLF